MPRATPYVKLLDDVARKLGSAKPEKVHGLIYDAFKVAALAGDAAVARALLDAMYALPPPKRVLTALSTHAIDVFARAAGFGDVTAGKPTYDYAIVKDGPLDERVAAIARGVRARITENAFDGDYPKSDAWRKKKRSDPFFTIDRWRRVQYLAHPDRATPATERDALERIAEILADWPADERGPGMGSELVLGFELALRHGAVDRAAAWRAQHGHRLEKDDDLVETMICLPAVADAMVAGFFRPIVDVKALAPAFARALRAASALSDRAPAPRPAKKVPAVQRRTVTCEYSQIHLEPKERTAEERRLVFFQDKRESKQGMSLFATMVGIATPSETESVKVAVTIDAKGRPNLRGATRAVAFPLTVRGPLVLRSVGDGEDVEPIVVPNGAYDVLAVFKPMRAKRTRSGLRTFGLELSFRPDGSLGAPRCLVLEDGSKPPTKIFVNR